MYTVDVVLSQMQFTKLLTGTANSISMLYFSQQPMPTHKRQDA